MEKLKEIYQVFKQNIKNIIGIINNKIKSIVSKETFVMEFLFLFGVFIIIFTTFLLNTFLGLYALGILLILYSIFLYRISR